MSDINDNSQAEHEPFSTHSQPIFSLSPFKTCSASNTEEETSNYNLCTLPEPPKSFKRRNAIITTKSDYNDGDGDDDYDYKDDQPVINSTGAFAFLSQNPTTPTPNFRLFNFASSKSNDDQICQHEDPSIYCDRCSLKLSATTTATTASTASSAIADIITPRTVPEFGPPSAGVGKSERTRRSWQYGNNNGNSSTTTGGGNGNSNGLHRIGYHPYHLCNPRRDHHHHHHYQHQVSEAKQRKASSSSSPSSSSGLKNAFNKRIE